MSIPPDNAMAAAASASQRYLRKLATRDPQLALAMLRASEAGEDHHLERIKLIIRAHPIMIEMSFDVARRERVKLANSLSEHDLDATKSYMVVDRYASILENAWLSDCGHNPDVSGTCYLHEPGCSCGTRMKAVGRKRLLSERLI